MSDYRRVYAVLNPGLRTVLSFLEQFQGKTPQTFSDLYVRGERGYGMVGRYIPFCLDKKLIRVVEVRKGRRFPSRTYTLTEKGEDLLKIFQTSKVTGSEE